MTGKDEAIQDDALKVFISYSRAQVAFADDLELSLTHAGHQVLIDRSDIAYGEEDFQNRLLEMLEACDTVVFVLSDESAASDACIWETEQAKNLGKRTLVVTQGNLSEGLQPPPALAKINWVHCWRNPRITGSSQAKGFVELDTTLRSDIGWLRKRTAYQEDALNWQRRGSEVDSPILLRGELLAEAMDWSRDVPRTESVPDEIARFIKMSEDHENRLNNEAVKQANAVKRTARRWGAIAGALLVAAFGAGWLAWGNYQDAQTLSASAQKQSSDFLARESKAIFDNETGDHTLSMLMALQADPLAQRNALRSERFGEEGFENARAMIAASVTNNTLEKRVNSGNSPVNVIAISKDGLRWAVGHFDKLVRVWESDGESLELVEADPHGSYPHTLSFSPKDGEIASGSSDWIIRIWGSNLSEGPQLIEPNVGDVYSVAFSPDGNLFASGHLTSRVRLWDANTLAEKTTLEGHTDSVQSVAFSQDGSVLASGSSDNTIRLWSTKTGELLKVLEGHLDSVLWVAHSPVESILASGSSDGTIGIWDAIEGKELFTLDAQSTIRSVAFSPDGSRLISAGDDDKIRIWDRADGKEVATLDWAKNLSSNVLFRPDGNQFVSGSEDGTVSFWSSKTSDMVTELTGHDDFVSSVSYSRSGELIASSSSDQTIRIWDTRLGIEKDVLEGFGGPGARIAWSPNEMLLASGSVYGKVQLWDAETKKYRLLESGRYSVGALAFSPSGECLAVGSYNGEFRVWNLNSNEVLAVFEHPEGAGQVRSVEYSPDGNIIASGYSYGTIKLWDARQNTELLTLNGHSDVVNSLSFSEDGTLLASSGEDALRVWDTNTGTELITLEGFEYGIRSVQFSPDGTLIAGTSGTGHITYWDANTGIELASFRGHEKLVFSLAFSPDGSKIVSGSSDKSLRIWDVPEILRLSPPEQVRIACETLVDIGAKLAFDKSDLAKYPVLASEFAQEDQLRYDPDNPDVVIGLKSPCEGIVDLPHY